MMECLILQKLPNEILVAILDHLPVKELLKTTFICRQFHQLAIRSLHQQLLAVSPIPGYELILECYHPTLKISTPYLSCRYIGTRHPNDCDDAHHDDATTTSAKRTDWLELPEACQLYASFRPVVTEENRRRPFRMVWPVSVASRNAPPAGFDSEDQVATQDLNLDDGELFSQLCTVLNLVTVGRVPGVFVTHYNMSRHFVRLFRRWLGEMAAAATSDGQAWDAAAKVPLASNRILWVDAAKTIGLRFHVSLGPAERMPLLSGPGDEDPAVSYTLTYEELLVRSTSLLMAVEASVNQQMDPSHNSIILSPVAT